MGNLIGIIGILVLVYEIYRWLREKWIERILAEKKKGKRERKPQVMRPKSETRSGNAGGVERTERVEAGGGRGNQRKGTFVQIRSANITRLRTKGSMRWCGMGGMASKKVRHEVA